MGRKSHWCTYKSFKTLHRSYQNCRGSFSWVRNLEDCFLAIYSISFLLYSAELPALENVSSTVVWVFPYQLICLRKSDTGVSTAQLNVKCPNWDSLPRWLQGCVNLPIKANYQFTINRYFSMQDKWFLQEIESLKRPGCPILFKYWVIPAFMMIWFKVGQLEY